MPTSHEVIKRMTTSISHEVVVSYAKQALWAMPNKSPIAMASLLVGLLSSSEVCINVRCIVLMPTSSEDKRTSTSVSHEAVVSCAKQVSRHHGLPRPTSTLAPLWEGLQDHSFFRQHLCVAICSLVLGVSGSFMKIGRKAWCHGALGWWSNHHAWVPPCL
jgi:hypothetical protein